MAVYTGNPRFSATLLPREVVDSLVPVAGPGGSDTTEYGISPEIPLGPRFDDPHLSSHDASHDAPHDAPHDPSLGPLFEAVFPGFPMLYSTPQGDLPLRHLLLSEFSARSQYDQLIELVRGGAALPDGLACLAGSGLDFHGFKGRSWAAVQGNLHLAVHFSPQKPLDRFGPAFTALAALSVVDALDEIPELRGRSSIKWVNDVLVDGAKVAGTLAFTQSQEITVSSAVIGIGLNVEIAPRVSRSPTVPRVGSVREFLPGEIEAPRLQGTLLVGLLRALETNYATLLNEGASPLVDRYRERSAVIGRDVIVCAELADAPDAEEPILAQGRVVGFGDNLELLLEGRPDPLTGGRLILADEEECTNLWASESACGSGARSHSEGGPPL